MYYCQLNFVMFCDTSALGNLWQHLNQPNLLVCSIYQFHVYFNVQIIVYHLSIPLASDDGFGKVKNSYISSKYHSICDDYGLMLMKYG